MAAFSTIAKNLAAKVRHTSWLLELLLELLLVGVILGLAYIL